MVIEEDDEQLHFVTFMRHERVDHWVRQLFDIYIPLGRNLDEVGHLDLHQRQDLD